MIKAACPYCEKATRIDIGHCDWCLKNLPDSVIADGYRIANNASNRPKLSHDDLASENAKMRDMLKRALPFVERWHGVMDNVKIPLIDEIKAVLQGR